MTRQTKTRGAAPVAPRRPHSFTTHGITMIDDYAWLKDADWQEVLRDPAILDADIRKFQNHSHFSSSVCSGIVPAQRYLGDQQRRGEHGDREQPHDLSGERDQQRGRAHRHAQR